VYGSGYGNSFWLFIYIDWWRRVAKFALKVDVEKDEGGLTSGIRNSFLTAKANINSSTSILPDSNIQMIQAGMNQNVGHLNLWWADIAKAMGKTHWAIVAKEEPPHNSQPVGGFNHLHKYESQWEWLSHIIIKLWKINMFETTNQSIYTERYASPYINGSQIHL